MLTIGLYGIPDCDDRHAAHDHGVSIMRDGLVLDSVELERFTGRKHDNRLGLYFKDLVSPWLKKGEKVYFVQADSFVGGTFKSNDEQITISAPDDMSPEKIIMKSHLSTFGVFSNIDAEAYTISHELAHIGTCLPFFGSFKDNSLLVHVDGGASKSSSSAWLYSNNKLELIEYSWKILKDQVNLFNDNPLSAAILGLTLADHLSMPGKLMGFASLGNPREDIMEWLKQNNWFLDSSWKDIDMLEIVCKQWGLKTSSSDPTRERLHWDIAACMQKYFEDSLLNYIGVLQKKTGAKHLYYSGGAALNIHANTRIDRDLNFNQVHIPPAPSDCGLALGAAAFHQWNSGMTIDKHSPFLNRLSKCSNQDSDTNKTMSVEEVAKVLADGEVVATSIRDAECGPRALGHRSLLVRPDSVSKRRLLSEKMKKREWYRPVAPLMLEETASEALEDFSPSDCLTDYMLGAWKIKSQYLKSFRGCIHADGSVRAQIIRSDQTELSEIYKLLQLLKDKYGVYGLINTSFNERGKPIVQTMHQVKEHAFAIGIKHIWAI